MNSLLEEQLASILGGYKPDSGQRKSWLLNYLPGFYAGDEFLNRFLLIFEDTLRPLQLMTDNLNYYFHPLTAPTDLIPWLATGPSNNGGISSIPPPNCTVGGEPGAASPSTLHCIPG
jgi:hypothetical protein